jgi:ATP-binding cassette, subfamily B, vacuolar membrane transporter HMT1/ACLQ
METLKAGQEHRSATESAFLTLQLLYPLVLLVTFIVTAGAHSILTARSEEDIIVPEATGPGGKPLPVTKRKKETGGHHAIEQRIGPIARRAFQYVSVLLVLTYVANGVNVATHALAEREPSRGDGDRDRPAGQQGWWCTQERTV